MVDQLAVASPTTYYDPENRPPDLAYYHRLVAGTRVRVVPMVIAWDITPGKPSEPLSGFCRSVADWYRQGADGVALWDIGTVGNYRKNDAEGDPMDLLCNLGNRELVSHWAKHGVPAPHAVPFLKLGENEYSDWLPNRGY